MVVLLEEGPCEVEPRVGLIAVKPNPKGIIELKTVAFYFLIFSQ